MRQIRLLQLNRRNHILPSLLPQPPRPPLQNNRRIRLRHNQQRYPRRARKNQPHPQAPPPVDDADKPADDRPAARTPGGGSHEERHRPPATLRTVKHVRASTADDGDRACRRDAGEQPEYGECGEVRGECGRKREDCEGGEGGDHDGFAAERFGEGAEEDGP